jgi:hypothetical protein
MRELVVVHAWGAAAFNALIGSHDLVEAVAGWLDRLAGLM